MRTVIQRVSRASVQVSGSEIGAIGRGLVVFLAIHRDDKAETIGWMADKIINLRIFADDQDKMNLSLADINAEMLIVSQFTLYGDCRKGRRPGYSDAAPPEIAEQMYNDFISAIKRRGITAAAGKFQAMMQVALINDGPVTLLIDSAKTF